MHITSIENNLFFCAFAHKWITWNDRLSLLKTAKVYLKESQHNFCGALIKAFCHSSLQGIPEASTWVWTNQDAPTHIRRLMLGDWCVEMTAQLQIAIKYGSTVSSLYQNIHREWWLKCPPEIYLGAVLNTDTHAEGRKVTLSIFCYQSHVRQTLLKHCEKCNSYP